MHAIVLAGGETLPDDPLYPYTHGRPKALLPLAGRPLLAWTLAALAATRHIERAWVVGVTTTAVWQGSLPVSWLPDQGSMVRNALAGLAAVEEARGAGYCVLLSADIPLLSGPILERFIDNLTPHNALLYYPFIWRDVMEARFPHAHRTYTQLRDGVVTGGNVALVHTALRHTNPDLWEAITHARKHAWRIARLVGFSTLAKLLLHRLSLADIQAVASRLIDGPAIPFICPDPEIGMDIDKPVHVQLLEADLSRQPPTVT